MARLADPEVTTASIALSTSQTSTTSIALDKPRLKPVASLLFPPVPYSNPNDTKPPPSAEERRSNLNQVYLALGIGLISTFVFCLVVWSIHYRRRIKKSITKLIHKYQQNGSIPRFEIFIARAKHRVGDIFRRPSPTNRKWNKWSQNAIAKLGIETESQIALVERGEGETREERRAHVRLADRETGNLGLKYPDAALMRLERETERARVRRQNGADRMGSRLT